MYDWIGRTFLFCGQRYSEKTIAAMQGPHMYGPRPARKQLPAIPGPYARSNAKTG